MNRRGFLRSLGLASTAAIAFPKAIHAGTWLFPESIVQHTGPVTAQWISAEALAILRELYWPKLRIVAPVTEGIKDFQHFGVDLTLPQFEEQPDLNSLREAYLRPAMTLFANQLEDAKPTRCLPLQLPMGVDFVSRAVDAEQGLDLRYVRAYDVWHDKFVNRFDIAVA